MTKVALSEKNTRAREACKPVFCFLEGMGQNWGSVSKADACQQSWDAAPRGIAWTLLTWTLLTSQDTLTTHHQPLLFTALGPPKTPGKHYHCPNTKPFPSRYCSRKAIQFGTSWSVVCVPLHPAFQSLSRRHVSHSWLLDVALSPWEANRCFWFPPNACSAAA